MKKSSIKTFLNIAFVALIVWLFFTSDLAGLKIILAIALVGIIISHNQLAKFVEKEVVKVVDERLASYRARIWIYPDWYEIIKHLFPKLKDTGEINKFVEEQLKRCSESKNSLVHKIFGFVEFYDGVSGMTQIWSETHKTFVDEMENRGYIFDYDKWVDEYNKHRDKKEEKYKITDHLVIRPEFIGFHTILPDGEVLDDCKLGTIPYGEIISFFIEARKRDIIGGEMKAVKTFPPKLAEELKKNGAEYNIEDYNHEDYGCGGEFKKDKVMKFDDGAEFYDQKMKYHSFKTKYDSVGIEIEIF